MRYCFAGDPSTGPTERWRWQGLQGDRRRPPAEQVPHQLVYATAVRRTSDPAGTTQCARPQDVPDAWVLRDEAGRPVTRGQGGEDTALDVGDPGFQLASADFLVAKCRRERWAGVLHDEFNPEFGFGWDGAVPAKHPTTQAWQAALLGYVTVLARRLADAGFLLAGNIGTVTRYSRGWNQQLVDAGLVPVSEFFVTGATGNGTIATAENGLWAEQVDWLDRNLAAGRTVVVHERQTDEALVRYGLGTFLLCDDGHGVFGADVDYDAATTPYPDCFADAVRLGSPGGARTELRPGLWRRRFSHGHVLVNSSGTATTWDGVTVAPTTATLSLT